MNTVDGLKTRPTTDRVKESVFNIINKYIADAFVLDLFAGTGNLGIEALSRGAERVVFVDKARESIAVVKSNLAKTHFTEKAEIYQMDSNQAIKKFSEDGRKFDLIFTDPPYGKNILPDTFKIIVEYDIISNNGLIVSESNLKDALPERIENLKMVRNQKYGETIISFYLFESDD